MSVILVTGGAGFIGSHVCEALLKKGETVVTVDNLDPYYDLSQKEGNIALLRKHKGFTYYRQDICDREGLAAIFEKHKPERVIHLAAKAGVRASLEFPKLYEEVNVGGTVNLLELANKHKVKLFVLGSSSSVYGSRSKVPFRESDPVGEPISPYAASKRSAELFCYVFHSLYNLNIVCFRFFTVFGPRGRPDMIPFKFTKLVLEGKPIIRYGDGSSKRDYTYVGDVVSGILATLDKTFGFEIINLGNNKTVTLNDFIATIERVTGQKAKIIEEPMPKADVPITCADITKARKMLGFSPSTGLEEGLTKFFEWYKTK